MDASKTPGADRARRFPFFEVGRLARDFQQAAWNFKLMPSRLWLDMRRRLAGGFPFAGWGGDEKAVRASARNPDGDGSKGAKASRFDSLATIQRRTAACKAEGCPLAAEVERRAREVEGQDLALWEERAEVEASRREVLKMAREVNAEALEVMAQKREMAAMEGRAAAVEGADKQPAKPERPMEVDASKGPLRWWQKEMLTPCPFCGGRDLEIRGPSHIECQDCGGRKLKGWTRGWNRRTTKRKPREVDGVLPCPFCGKYPKAHPKAFRAECRSAFVECECGAKAPDVETWNKRAELGVGAERVWGHEPGKRGEVAR